MKDIKIGKGVGLLEFDTTRDQVKQLLGAPEETERFSLSELENDETEAWHYDALGLSLSFDEENNWLLSSIAVSAEEYVLDGVALIGKSKKEVLQFLEKKNWHNIEEDEEVSKDNPGNCLLHVEDAGISLWFENDELTEMQIGPLFE